MLGNSGKRCSKYGTFYDSVSELHGQRLCIIIWKCEKPKTEGKKMYKEEVSEGGVSGRETGAGVCGGETELQKLLITFMPSPHI
jgi:hypothetical protein